MIARGRSLEYAYAYVGLVKPRERPVCAFCGFSHLPTVGCTRAKYLRDDCDRRRAELRGLTIEEYRAAEQEGMLNDFPPLRGRVPDPLDAAMSEAERKAYSRDYSAARRFGCELLTYRFLHAAYMAERNSFEEFPAFVKRKFHGKPLAELDSMALDWDGNDGAAQAA